MLDQITSSQNLMHAWDQVRKKVGSAGPGGFAFGEFQSNWRAGLHRLAEELQSGLYRPRPIRICPLPKGRDGKFRFMGLLAVRDRIAQRAFLNVLGPFYERRFLPSSFGYRPGKGVDSAIKRVTDLLYGKGCRWVVHADIQAFFDSISHPLLVRGLMRDIPDRRVVRTMTLWLSFAGRREARGIVLGAVISPLMANIYLHPFDVEMSRRHRDLIRYSDDFVMTCRSKEQARLCLMEARQVLHQLGLRLNESKTWIVDGYKRSFRFLGKILSPSFREGLAGEVRRGPIYGRRAC